MRRLIGMTSLVMVLVLCGRGLAWAEQTSPPEEQRQAPDQDTPRGEAPTLDELLNLPTAPRQPAGETGREGEPDDPDGLLPELPEPRIVEVPESRPSDTFRLAVTDMEDAAERLDGHRDPGLDTQRVQERAIRRLDQLIDQMRNQRQAASQGEGQPQDTGSEQNPSRPQEAAQQRRGGPANQSADRAGPRGRVEDGERDDRALSETLSEWGNLPARLRDQLLQGREDRVSPLYQRLTERYYRRLAEESP